MWGILNMRVTSLVAVVAPRRGNIINGLYIFERGENLLQNGIFHFVFTLANRQKSCYKGRIYADEKLVLQR